MKWLIVNADDFGLHSAVNHGIIEGYEKGCIRSTSFIAAGAAAEEAAALAQKHPGLGVGIHLTLVAEHSVLPPSEVPSLIWKNGRFLPDHVAFIRRYMTGGVRREELYAECEAQILRAKKWGSISPISTVTSIYTCFPAWLMSSSHWRKNTVLRKCAFRRSLFSLRADIRHPPGGMRLNAA